jgi:hypothetical protein
VFLFVRLSVGNVIKSEKESKETHIEKTAVQKGTSSPQWVNCFLIDYYFERVQKVRFSLFHDNGKEGKLIGYADSSLSAIVGARGKLELHLTNEAGDKGLGSITIFATQVKRENLQRQVGVFFFCLLLFVFSLINFVRFVIVALLFFFSAGIRREGSRLQHH